MAAGAQAVTGAEEAIQVVEDVEKLELHHQSGATPDRRLELLEYRRFDGGHVEVDRERRRRLAKARILQHRQYAQIQHLGQMLEQPAVGQDVDVGRQNFLQVHDGHEKFLECHLGGHLLVDVDAGLAPHHAGDVGGADAFKHLAQILGVEVLDLRCCALVGGLLLRVDHHLAGQREEGIVIGLEVVERNEAVLAVSGFGVGQRISGKQRPQLVDDGIQIGEIGVLADEDDVRIGHQEHLAAIHVDHGFEHAEGNADAAFLPIAGKQTGQMKVQRHAPLPDAADPFGRIEKKAFRRHNFLLSSTERTGVHPNPIHQSLALRTCVAYLK
ncbi:conserved hypothetical protein [Candidatus Terasakiella magnetica]|nr:conserved hypothetical protein [Candidatus Terasakiella magnetica]